MVIFNITFIIESTMAHQWIQWTSHHVKNNYLTSPFVKGYKWLKLIDSPNEGQTVCLQLFFDKSDDLLQFQKLYIENFDRELWEQFPNLFVCYKSTMQELKF